MYQELKKIKRSSYYGQLITETTIAKEGTKDQPATTFTNVHSDIKNKDFTRLELKKDYGAGVSLTIQKVKNNRMYQWFCSLGKCDIELLKEFIALVEPELKDYDGKFEPVELITLK